MHGGQGLPSLCPVVARSFRVSARASLLSFWPTPTTDARAMLDTHRSTRLPRPPGGFTCVPAPPAFACAGNAVVSAGMQAGRWACMVGARVHEVQCVAREACAAAGAWHIPHATAWCFWPAHARFSACVALVSCLRCAALQFKTASGGGSLPLWATRVPLRALSPLLPTIVRVACVRWHGRAAAGLHPCLLCVCTAPAGAAALANKRCFGVCSSRSALHNALCFVNRQPTAPIICCLPFASQSLTRAACVVGCVSSLR
jgi:hypothetical protein